MTRPLRKKSAEGDLYVRQGSVTSVLSRLDALPRKALAQICRTGAFEGGRLPSECLMSVARSAIEQGDQALFEASYSTLEGRVRRTMPTDRAGRGAVSDADLFVRDAVLDRLRGMLALDAAGYCESLDFYEVRFDAALARARLDARRALKKKTELWVPLTDQAGDVRPDVEAAALALRDEACDVEAAYRLETLQGALSMLPELQRRIVELLMTGMPIASSDGLVSTISRTLSRSERSVRTHRDKAFERIRAYRARHDRDERSRACCAEASGAAGRDGSGC